MSSLPRPQGLHVAFVTDTIEGKLGGGVVAGRYVVDALRHQHRVTVVAADATGADDVRLRGFQLPLRSMREMQFVMARPDREALSRVFREVDIVHVQFPFWLGTVAVDEARRADRPIVAAFHVQPENALANIGIRSPWLSREIYAYWVSRVFDRADAVVCPTLFGARKLRAHGLTRPAHVVSNGVPPDVRILGPRVPSRDRAFRVLSIGRLSAEKRQDVIVEAVRRSRHRDRIRLVLAGGGPRESTLRALGQRLPHPPEIGFLPRSHLLARLRNADLFVHASEVELEGIAVLEAMSVGLPALVAQSAESAASDFALSDDFRFAAGDADALAAKIDRLADHPALLDAASAAYREVARRLSFEESVESLISLYSSLHGSGRPRRVAGPLSTRAA